MAGRINARAYAMAGILTCYLGCPVHAQASEAPRVSIQSSEGLSAHLSDGDIIARGRVETHDTHAGFQVWSDVSTPGSAPDRYVIAGTRNERNRLHVRIERVGGRPDRGGGKGLIIDTGDDVAPFSVVSDGEQTVVADSYQFVVRAAVVDRNGLGEPVQQLATLDFAAGRVLRHELRAAQPVFSTDLADNTLLAIGVVSTQDASEQRIAVRFAQGDGERNGDVRHVVLSGENNDGHKLRVKLQFPEVVAERNNWVVKAIAHPYFDYTVNADGSQEVPPDTYIVRVESAVWSE